MAYPVLLINPCHPRRLLVRLLDVLKIVRLPERAELFLLATQFRNFWFYTVLTTVGFYSLTPSSDYALPTLHLFQLFRCAHTVPIFWVASVARSFTDMYSSFVDYVPLVTACHQSFASVRCILLTVLRISICLCINFCATGGLSNVCAFPQSNIFRRMFF